MAIHQKTAREVHTHQCSRSFFISYNFSVMWRTKKQRKIWIYGWIWKLNIKLLAASVRCLYHWACAGASLWVVLQQETAAWTCSMSHSMIPLLLELTNRSALWNRDSTRVRAGRTNHYPAGKKGKRLSWRWERAVITFHPTWATSMTTAVFLT